MSLMKRNEIRVVLSAMLILMLSSSVQASEGDYSIHSSDYIRYATVTLSLLDNGQLEIDADMAATRVMNQLGVVKITIQAWVNNQWVFVEDVVNHSYSYNSMHYKLVIGYWGSPGVICRAQVEFLAMDSTGSETQIVVSAPVILMH